jgi:Zn-dependent protease
MPALCPRCGANVPPGELACPTCGLLVHLDQLRELAEQAQFLETQDPAAAAALWRECLQLLPPNSEQSLMLQQRIALLESAAIQPAAPPTFRQRPLIRTGGSMVLSMAVYAIFFGPAFAIGFVILIWVHEMGHVVALRRYGVRATAPLFIPFVGAVITIGRLRNAAEEAVMGIAGPIFGTLGGLLCFLLYLGLRWNVLLDLSFFTFSMNLLNLLPIPPLDGGRVTAAVSPWIWPFGLAALVSVPVLQFIQGGRSLTNISPLPILILVFAAPRLWRTFRYRENSTPYYQIPRSSSWAIGTAYVLLALVLIAMVALTYHLSPPIMQ